MTQATLPLPAAPTLGTAEKPLPAVRGMALWPCAVWAILGLVYLVWAGSGADPRLLRLWMYTKTGWFVPAAGLSHFWAASAIVIAALSIMAYRIDKNADTPGKRSLLAQLSIVGIILIVALDIRLAIMRTWLPFSLEQAFLTPRAYRAVAAPGRGGAIFADMITVGILLLALGAQRRSLWLAALYAFHPVVLMQVAGNGSWIAWLMPVLALAALGWRLQRWLRDLLVMGAAAGCTWWVAHLALTKAPFDGWLAECLGSLGWDERPVALMLIVVEMALQVMVMVLAARRGWSLARTLGHVLLAWAVVSPRVMPADVLPILVLLPLAWTRGGWVLGAAILGLYMIAPLSAGHQRMQVPAWVVFLVMVPVVVTAAEEWVAGIAEERPMAWWLKG